MLQSPAVGPHSDPEPLAPGVRLDDRFVLERQLGRGGYGSVWSATDGEQHVAIKILHPHLTDNPRVLARLTREAEILMSLDHPNMARALHFSSEGPRTYVVVELLTGHNLAVDIGAHTRSGRPFSIAEVGQRTLALCSALEHAHGHGIVHRDIKPQNVMITDAGEVKLLDFGLARREDVSKYDATTLGRTFGSPMYMAPEQIRGEPGDARTDLFALGCVLFEMLTLHRAWARDADERPVSAFDQPVKQTGANARAKILARIVAAPRISPKVLRHDTPAGLEGLVLSAMAAAPDARPQSAAEFAEAVRHALELRGDATSKTMLTPLHLADAVVDEANTIAKTASVVAPRPNDGVVAPDALPEATQPDPTDANPVVDAARPTHAGPGGGVPPTSSARQPGAGSDGGLATPDGPPAHDTRVDPVPLGGGEEIETLPGADTEPGAAEPRVPPRIPSAPAPLLPPPRRGPSPVVMLAGALLFTAFGFGLAVAWMGRTSTRPSPVSVAPEPARPLAATVKRRTSPEPVPTGNARADGPTPSTGDARSADEPTPTAGGAPGTDEPPSTEAKRTAGGRAAPRIAGQPNGDLTEATSPSDEPTRNAAAPTAAKQKPQRTPPAGRAPAPATAKLRAELARVRAEPTDAPRIDALASAIVDATADLEDPAAKRRIRRCAGSNAMVADIDGLAGCIADLEAALPK